MIQATHDRSCLWSDSNLKQCSCLEILDQQGNPNLTPLVVISTYHMVSELQAQDRIYVSFAFLLNLIFILLLVHIT